ncbi:MAG: putative integral membrane protein (TIGR00698 family) [Colwellia sp.]|jgi:uncharacterized integral membrane protein (TIGR00698 family)
MMAFSKNNRANTFNGLLFVALLAMAATYIAEFSFCKQLAISPLIIGIVVGMLYGNSLRHKFPNDWHAGILFSTKTLLRAGIVFYGFRLTFQNVVQVGVTGILLSSIIVITTFVFGYWFGTKVLKLDRDTSILISAGSAICGAAAVLATEPVIKAEPYKTSIAVATVVVFGTIAMFTYPLLYKSGLLGLTEQAMGAYIGGTLHEVAHVVGAGASMGDEIANTAIIVKMLRVMLLAPFLLVLSIWIASLCKQSNKANDHAKEGKNTKTAITIPWFALGFIGVVGFNSLNLLPVNWVDNINQLDNFALTMAMTALGMETRFNQFKGVGFKPIYLASVLFAYLMTAGYLLSYYLVA